MPGMLVRRPRQEQDHPLDLAPAAEMNDIAPLPAFPCPSGGLGRSEDPEAIDEVRRIGGGRAVGQMDMEGHAVLILYDFPRLA